MKPIKITAGRHHAWFNKTFVGGFSLVVRKPYIPPEGCHPACGLKLQEESKPRPDPVENTLKQGALVKHDHGVEFLETKNVKLSWWKRLVLFIKKRLKI